MGSMRIIATSHMGFIVKNLDAVIDFYNGVFWGIRLLRGFSEELIWQHLVDGE